MDPAPIRIRLVVDSGGACAVLVTRPDRDASFAAEIPHVARRLESAGLRFAGISIAESDPGAPGGSVTLRPGETLGAAVRRALSGTAAVGTSP